MTRELSNSIRVYVLIPVHSYLRCIRHVTPTSGGADITSEAYRRLLILVVVIGFLLVLLLMQIVSIILLMTVLVLLGVGHVIVIKSSLFISTFLIKIIHR